MRRGSILGGKLIGQERKRGAGASITVQVDAVELNGKAALQERVLLEVEMPGDVDGERTKSAAAPVRLQQAKVNLLAKYDVGDPESPVRSALVAAL